MQVIELSHTLRQEMPLFPGTVPPCFETVGDYAQDGFRETLVSMTTHTGTHIDPPAHVIPGGRTLDALPPSQFAGEALVIDCRDIGAGGEISAAHILRSGAAAERAEFLLFCTGWDALWGKPSYFAGYPCLSTAALELILGGAYKGIGFDTAGIDPVADAALPQHKQLFMAHGDRICIENLKNLSQCVGGLFSFACLPLKIAGSDGAPARAIAWIP